MTIWAGEIKELGILAESFKSHLPAITKEIEQLIKTDDPNVVMLYSRRCLEVIITELCETELKRPRKTEPLKGIIDKLNSEEKVPSHIINSMLSLNSMATFGAHPKDFDPEQVKPVLNNLAIIIKWYLRFKNSQIISKTDEDDKILEINPIVVSTRKSLTRNRQVMFVSTGIILGFAFMALLIFVLSNNDEDKSSKDWTGIEKTIALLPFRNLSNDSAQLYFCDGFMNEIIINLQEVKEFTVRSSTSTDQYRLTNKPPDIIGKEIDVNYLIAGDVARDEKNLKIWINLINARTNESIWSKTYLRQYKEIFSLQSEIAKEIAGELKTFLTPEEINQIDKSPTENLEAYRYYLLGNFYSYRSFAKQDFEIAIKMYEKALESDPDFALAHVRIAICYLTLHWFNYDPNQDRLMKSKEAIDAAFTIEPDIPDAHLALGIYYYWGFLNYTKALQEVDIALQKLKNSECYYTKATIFLRAGDFSNARENHLKAFSLDPGIPKISHNLAVIYSLSNEYIEAEKYFDKALSVNPAFIESSWQKSFLYMKWEGNTIRSRKTIEEAYQFEECKISPLLFETNVLQEIYDSNYQKALTKLSEKNINNIFVQFYVNLKSLLYARTYSLLNQSDMANKYYNSALVTLDSMLLTDPTDSRLYSAIGIAYAGLGMKEKAIEAGKRGVELMPVNKEAYRGVFRVEDLARIYVMVGEYKEAIYLIDQLLKIPSRLSVKLLKLDPVWKPLWDLPEFKKIVSTGS